MTNRICMFTFFCNQKYKIIFNLREGIISFRVCWSTIWFQRLMSQNVFRSYNNFHFLLSRFKRSHCMSLNHKVQLKPCQHSLSLDLQPAFVLKFWCWCVHCKISKTQHRINLRKVKRSDKCTNVKRSIFTFVSKLHLFIAIVHISWLRTTIICIIRSHWMCDTGKHMFNV